jgi:phosphoserine aminotransferase
MGATLKKLFYIWERTHSFLSGDPKMPLKPTFKPSSPCFSSGPAAKRPGWSWDTLKETLLGRSHRAPKALERLQETLDLVREVLEIPPTHHVLFTPGSATGAVESAMWSLLGTRPVHALAWDIFGARWQDSLREHLKINGQVLSGGPQGPFPDLSKVNPDHDVLFTWNGSTGGACVPNTDWICDHRRGLTVCDATSAAFVMPLDWAKLDATAFSWQKGLGAEANQGILVLGPRAITHLNTHPAQFPIPFSLSLRRNGVYHEPLSKGWTLNTPSLMCLEDFRQALLWAKNLGGQAALYQRVKRNNDVFNAWIPTQKNFDFMVEEPAIRSSSTVCLKLTSPQEDPWIALRRITETLAQEGVAFDILNHYMAQPCLRIWCGPTIESTDLERLVSWLDWASDRAAPPTTQKDLA